MGQLFACFGAMLTLCGNCTPMFSLKLWTRLFWGIVSWGKGAKQPSTFLLHNWFNIQSSKPFDSCRRHCQNMGLQSEKTSLMFLIVSSGYIFVPQGQFFVFPTNSFFLILPPSLHWILIVVLTEKWWIFNINKNDRLNHDEIVVLVVRQQLIFDVKPQSLSIQPVDLSTTVMMMHTRIEKLKCLHTVFQNRKLTPECIFSCMPIWSSTWNTHTISSLKIKRFVALLEWAWEHSLTKHVE